MSINKIRKVYTLTNGGGTNNLPATDPIELYIIKGNATLLASWVFQSSGTVYEGLEYIFSYQATMTLSGNNISFFGYSLTSVEALRNNTIIATYDGNASAWVVKVIHDMEEAGTVETADIADSAITAVKILAGITLPAVVGTNITGVPSSSLVGALPALNASALTNLSSANLTGALPAIDGSALTSVAAATVTTNANLAGDVTSVGNTTTIPPSTISHAMLNTSIVEPINLYGKSATALADADAVLTDAQLIGGIFTITPTILRTLTTDSLANILAALPGYAVGANFNFTIVCLAAFEARLAPGLGITIVGSTAVNNVSGSFTLIVDSAVAATIYRT